MRCSAELDAVRQRSGSAAATVDAAQRDVAAARQGERHANDRARAAGERLAAIEAERDAARAQAAAAEAQRDALLAERAERAGTPVRRRAPRHRARPGRARPVASPTRWRASSSRRVGGSRCPCPAAWRGSRPGRRSTSCGPAPSSSSTATTWPSWAGRATTLAVQRDRVLDVADDVARRLGSELVVVFDGADVVGGHARRRRLVRVAWSPPGVSADDVIRAEVAAVPAARPVVVVTNDQAIRRDVAAAGANTVVQRGLPRRRPLTAA